MKRNGNSESTGAPGGEVHQRARRLIDMERVEGISPVDQRWLEDHLAACEACASRASATEAALKILRTSPVPVPRDLAVSAQLIVRRRAEELRAQHARNVALAIGCTLSWVFGVASAPLVWKACAWLGATLDLPRVVWVLGFVTWWFVPLTVMGPVILWQRRRWEGESPAFGSRWEGR
ncbi:MAG TPA: hypothetical protein VGZ29_10680 [Terriglobia bacterium]|nr:hypothetical protein [Terriglobia bacterium]